MMKRCKIGKKISGVITLVMAFVIGVTPMTAFAQANPEGNQVVVEESVSDNSVVDKQVISTMEDSGNVTVDSDANVDNVAGEDNTTEVADTELPYSYTINEDGSIVFNFNGEEYVYGEEEDPTGTLKEDVYRLNVRTGAGMDYEVIDQLRPGEEVSVIGTEGNWYKIVVPERTGYVHKDYLDIIESATNKTDAALLQMFMLMFMDCMNNQKPANMALTPDGNMNLIDDYGSVTGAGKQFITLTTKSGNYFYLIIDRDDNGAETVHFLNLVDEADLLSLMDEEQAAEYTGENKEDVEPTVTPDEETPVESTKEPVEEPTEEPAKEKNSSMGVLTFILIAAIGGVGASIFIRKGKSKENTPGPDPDFDYNEDEEDYLAELDEEDVVVDEIDDEE
ncbi:SH3 domain-containing protein [Herbinix hemicellulosilytica]|uniref:SH3b domain-containing protein n=1 Tax=Herbinix hemicellulosilytica TaxID=1564487 RepID=A0A0H5SK02_HERHM|nr:DUF4366 domain-containing protein [Herbinix hemicellulosilytica]RBP57092.1 SH3 domain-containing protein [Herbinix hemicellulosilytica]CRZ35101.1 hypothetical protein HHT355_1902 [Herbinix hemicellulosilytica]